MSRSVRLLHIEQILLDHPYGLKRIELAKRLGVHKSTISRDITDLSTELPIIEEEHGLIRIDKTGYLHTIHLTMHEMEALHLSSRLFSKVMRFPFPHASGALRKLAEAQGKVSPALADRIRDTAEELDSFTRDHSLNYANYRRTVETLGLAISEKRSVLICHYSRNKESMQEFRLLPVTLEPHPEGKAVHLVGWDRNGEKPFFRTLKTERIESIVLENPSPEEFDALPREKIATLFKDAWSIWRTDTPPVSVRLRFSGKVADRVRETNWHASQILELSEDGSIIFSVQVAQPKEMYPWIRGWGPDVEVLEPDWLRVQHKGDFARGVNLYGTDD